MKRKRLSLLFVPFFFLCAFSALSAVGVFDMPERHLRHLQLLAQMDDAHKAGNYPAMEDACRKGLELGTDDTLWVYNLACALALQGKRESALETLDRAIRLGFTDTEQLKLDPDLAPLRETEGFKARLAQLAAKPRDAVAAASGPIPMAPDPRMTVTQNATNTQWSFQLGLFHALVVPPTNRPVAGYNGPETNALRAWLKEETASGCAGVLYANRDNNTLPVDVARFPGLMRLAFCRDMIDRRLHIGMPNTLFA